jgi:hypothetical protein
MLLVFESEALSREERKAFRVDHRILFVAPGATDADISWLSAMSAVMEEFPADKVFFTDTF